MEDLIVIDGRKDFKRIYLQQFVEALVNDDIFIDYGENKSMSCNKDNLLEKLFSEELLAISDMETEISIYSDKVAFMILRSDLDWWNTTRRKNILKEIINSSNQSNEQEVKEEVKETKEVKSNNRQMRVAIADLTEEGLCHIDICESSKTGCLKWLNSQIVRHYDLAGQFIQVFNLDFKDEDVYDIDKWKTAKELADEGKVKLQ